MDNNKITTAEENQQQEVKTPIQFPGNIYFTHIELDMVRCLYPCLSCRCLYLSEIFNSRISGLRKTSH